jgi:hypothetical protein
MENCIPVSTPMCSKVHL